MKASREHAFTAASVELTGSLVVAAPVDQAFEYFSPLGEKLWAPDWDPELLFPADAAWACGQVFRTRTGPTEILWLVTALERASHQVEYQRVEADRHVARVRVHCSPRADDRTDVAVSYRFVGLSEAGNEQIAAMTANVHAERMVAWQSWIERHLDRSRPSS